MNKTAVAVGIDLGATNLKGAIVDRQARVIAKHVRPLQTADPEGSVDEIVALVDQFLSLSSVARTQLAGVGIGAPGPMRYRTGTIARAANLPGWENLPLRDLVQDRLRVPVVFDNDGNAAAFGEFWAGAGRDGQDLVMLTLGTGVGAGVILNGRIFHGHHDNAAELGHTIVAANGLPCPCGQRGCLEQYASAGAVARRVTSAIEAGEHSTLTKVALAGQAIDAKLVADSARNGDPLCLRMWDEACLHLAVACINIQHAFNPARVVLGGGMAEAGDFLLDRVTHHVTEQRWSLCDDLPQIVLAKLGYDAGVIGAAGLVLQQGD
jgi:glucokinase